MKRTIAIFITLLLLPAFIVTAQQEESGVTLDAKLLAQVAQGKAVLACPGCDLRGANFSGYNLTKANLSRANLEGADLSKTTLDDADLSGADLRGANLDGMTCARCDLSGAQLDRISMKGARLSGADLQNVSIAPEQLESVRRQAAAFDATLSSAEEFDAREPWACGYSDLSKVTKRIHVSTKGKDDNGCGLTPDSPCLTIAKGIAQCPNPPAGCAVLVEFGEYRLKETLQLVGGVDLHGGCIGQSRHKPDLRSLIVGADGYIAAQATARGAKMIQGFEIHGGNALLNGAASIALHVVQPVTVLNSRIVAGRGANGRAGGAGAEGGKGGDGSGQDGGGNAACGNTGGGRGGSGRSVSVENYWDVIIPKFRCTGWCTGTCEGATGSSGEASGGKGGGRGGDNCAECPVTDGGTGVLADAGTAGSCGSGGTPDGSTMGFMQNGYWVPGSGGSGTRGKFGGGGGGGGGGGYFAGSCFGVKTERNGGNGGGGGAGGCGGGLASGGQQGGASIGILLVGGPLVIKDSHVTAGIGGDGGVGGAGGKGGVGGSGAGGSSGGSGAGKGGGGGKGGTGGAGGGGAGGNGGPSIGIAIGSGSTVTETNVVYYTGTAGKPGGLGKGGAQSDGGICTGPDGQNGRASSAVNKQQF